MRSSNSRRRDSQSPTTPATTPPPASTGRSMVVVPASMPTTISNTCSITQGLGLASSRTVRLRTPARPTARSTSRECATHPIGGSNSGGHDRPDLGAEALDLLGDLLRRAADEAQLPLVGVQSAVPRQALGDPLGRADQRPLGHVEARVSDVDRL